MSTSVAVSGSVTTDPLLPRPHRVVTMTSETPDMYTVDLAPEDGRDLAFAPGQFTMVSAFGVGECAISLSGDPQEPGHVVHTIRAVGSVTNHLRGLRPGDVVGIRGPFGSGWPVDDAVGGDLLILAGGCGLAPVRPVILHALRHRDRFRNVTVLIGVRTPEDLPYREQIAGWAGREDADVRVTVDLASAGWEGPVGVVTELLPGTQVDPSATTAFVVGPEVMMRHTTSALAALDVPMDRIHVSLERTMRCGVGTCGHCQLGPVFVCRDGPVFPVPQVAHLLEVRER